MAVMERTITFTVRPFATVEVSGGDAGDLLDRVLSALEADQRAIGPVCAYNYDKQQIDAVFQVAAPISRTAIYRATEEALSVFGSALEEAFDSDVPIAVVDGLAIVEGDDPDLLP